MSGRKARPKRRHRRALLENLESRRLLTTLAADLLPFRPVNEFVVQRDDGVVDLFPLIGGVGFNTMVPTSVIEEAEGTITFDAEGSDIQYQPAEGFVGVDTFTISFVDPRTLSAEEDGESLTTEVRMAVNVIDPWYAVDDWYQVDAGATEPTELDVLQNDFAQRFQTHSEPRLTVVNELLLRSVRTEGDGVVAISGSNRSLQYTPATDFTGVETIHYTAQDFFGHTVEGTTRIRVSSETPDTMWPEQLQQQLLEQATEQNQFRFAQSASNDFGYGFPILVDGGFPRDLEFTDLTLAVADADVSGTNNQLSDVDESDRIKTDGEFLYVLSEPEANNWFGWGFFNRIGVDSNSVDGDENVLTVVDIRTADTPVIVSRQVLSDKVESLDLYGDRLTVIASRGTDTAVSVLDVSDPTEPVTVSTTVVDGNFKQARRVGETLYVFTNEFSSRTPAIETIDIEDGAFSFYETASQYVDRVSDQLLAAALPSFDVYSSDGELVQDDVIAAESLDIDDFHVPRLNIITIDTASDVGGVLDWDVNFGGETILVTTDSIYVTDTQYNYTSRPQILNPLVDLWVPEDLPVVTEIDRYALADDGTVAKSASGAVPGTLRNSFSLDEYNGTLRIATENSGWGTSEEVAGTSIYVLQQTEDGLVTIGGVTGLAPGEQIYAVRFAGERGYVVTFRRVDPLFVVDLSDPTAPEVKGELKVPGYSQYLHVISEDHVLGVGRDADETTGLYEGLTVSLFNVSDPLNPTLQDRYLFDGGRSTFSPFAAADPFNLVDHHAINYFSESGVLALPFYSTHGFGFSEDSDQPIFEDANESAVRTFRIDPTEGISVLDTIAFESRADRALRVGDLLYSLSPEQLKVTNLLEPDGVIASLDFQREGADDFVETPDGEDILVNVLANDGIDTALIEILAADIVDGAGTIEIVDDTQLRYTPEPGMLKPHRIRYTARDAAGTLIDAIATIDPDLQWHNPQNRLDTNADGQITPVDAIVSINTIQEHGFALVEDLETVLTDQPEDGLFEHFYVDSDNNGRVSAADVISIINFIADRAEVGGATVGFELDQPFEVTASDVAKLFDTDLTLAVSDVLEDSTCPVDATCVWEGRVLSGLEVSDDDDQQAIELTHQSGQEHAVAIGNYSIELIEVSPEAQTDVVAELSDYTFTLLVSQLES